jgi:hypothetical protein
MANPHDGTVMLTSGELTVISDVLRRARFGPGLWPGPGRQAREPSARHVTVLTGVTITSPTLDVGVPSHPYGSVVPMASQRGMT